MPFDRIKRDIVKLKTTGINSIISDGIKRNANTIIKMNTDGQLYNEGIDKFGVKLREYKDITKKLKAAKGQRTDHTTLKDSGDFYKSYFLKIFSDSFEINSDDPKRDDLFQKYGSGIFGLTEDNMRILRNILRLDLLQQIRKRI